MRSVDVKKGQPVITVRETPVLCFGLSLGMGQVGFAGYPSSVFLPEGLAGTINRKFSDGSVAVRFKGDKRDTLVCPLYLEAAGESPIE